MERPPSAVTDAGARQTAAATGAGSTALPRAAGVGITRSQTVAAAVLLAIVAVAAALRLWMIEANGPNPFYDAAVRSMGSSWHNFFFGALEPGGSLAIDKPPVDLWLQVASTKLLGFTRAALALPEALGGIAAVGLLYGAVSRACGRLAGALSALALAVLPIAVLTSRSDTMDSLMAALLVAALWAAVAAVERRRASLVLASAALVGLAFEVKLAQALVPLPALAVLWWVASGPGRRRWAVGAGAAAVLALVALAWPLAASLTPAGQRPMPIGSKTGSIFRSVFWFNGIERLTGSSQGLTPTGFRSAPGVARLLGGVKPAYGTLVGLELLTATTLLLAAGALVVLARRWRPVGPRAPTGVLSAAAKPLTFALAVWLATGCLLFSFMKRLEPRYLEAVSPAIAAGLGIACAHLLRRAGELRAAWACALALVVNATAAIVLAGAGDAGVMVCLIASGPAVALLCMAPLRRRLSRRPWTAGLTALATLALLAAPAEASIDLTEGHGSDANPAGSGAQYSHYLKAHRGKAFYETAAASPLTVVALIAQDGQPVLIFRTVDGTLVSVARLKSLVGAGAVRFAILPHACSGGRHCTPATAWTVHHAVQVKPGLYRYDASLRRRQR